MTHKHLEALSTYKREIEICKTKEKNECRKKQVNIQETEENSEN